MESVARPPAGDVNAVLLVAQEELLAGRYDNVIAMWSEYEDPPPELGELVSWAYTMQGVSLSEKAQNTTGKESEQFYAHATEMYEAAVRIKPDDHEALYNWGAALLARARTRSADDAEPLYTGAREKLMRAEQLSPGTGSYDLACLCSLLGEENDCLEWLQKSLGTGTLPNPEHLSTDSDLDRVRDCDWFKQFLTRVTA